MTDHELESDGEEWKDEASLWDAILAEYKALGPAKFPAWSATSSANAKPLTERDIKKFIVQIKSSLAVDAARRRNRGAP